MKRKYERAYRAEWEQDPKLSSWISKAKDDPDVAFCKACNCKLTTRLSALKEHASTSKHLKNMSGFSGQSSVQKLFKKSILEEEVKKAELNMCAFLVEHNLPYRIMDHLSEIINKCFSIPDVAKSFSCKRTKAAAITYNVLKPELEREMHTDLTSCQNISTKAPVYSIIIDKSTDVSSNKMLVIATKYYSGKIQNCNGQLKYTNISNFAKGLLCLPMSNASCERMFSQINLIKTKTRNRFINKHVASILHIKQVIGEHGDCIAFKPSKDMLNLMTKSMYKGEEMEEEDANASSSSIS